MKKKSLLSKVISLVFAGVVYVIYAFLSPTDVPQEAQVLSSENVKATLSRYDNASEQIANAFRNHQSDLIVESKGRVVKVLRDDTEGSAHQRFLLRLNNNHTILISHNIDLAPRIPNLSEGDTVIFKGEYEWNNKGGVVHWTHHDPRGRHEGGWLEHSGKRYQ